MCTALFFFGNHPTLLFFLAFNRDEFLERPTETAHWWEDEPDILAGRDVSRKGTWLGLTRSGRFAFLTNYREVAPNSVTNAPSRGDLPTNFLKGRSTPMGYLQSLDPKEHNGFNLLVGDLASGQVAYLTNRSKIAQAPVALTPGLYGLSNGVLDSKWPKVEKGKHMLQSVISSQDVSREAFPWEDIFRGVMGQCEKERDEAALPQTGLPAEIERVFSSIYIQPTSILGDPYGTRSQTVVAAWKDGLVQFRERSLVAPRETRSDHNLGKQDVAAWEFRLKSRQCSDHV